MDIINNIYEIVSKMFSSMTFFFHIFEVTITVKATFKIIANTSLGLC